MSKDFDFSGDSVAKSYDTVLVPSLFTPWAKQLLEEHGPWDGVSVLDLASGTGVVAGMLSHQVGAQGHVHAADLNPTMLSFAKKRCEGAPGPVTFYECSADALSLGDSSVDVALCQQGFQFFPDKNTAAKEIFRVLRPGGRTALTTWLPVSECELFGAICESLEAVGENGISEKMRIPFDHITAEELRAPFEAAGFSDITVERQEKDLTWSEDISNIGKFAYATPIGPAVKALAEDRREAFHSEFTKRVAALSPDGKTLGRMATSALRAVKAN